MSVVAWSILLLWCLAPFGFAWRGIALLRMREAKPGRMISASGVVAMISLWLFAGLAPVVASELTKIYREFDLELPWMTKSMISTLVLPLFYGLLWYPFVFGLGLCVLLLPEVLFYRAKPE